MRIRIKPKKPKRLSGLIKREQPVDIHLSNYTIQDLIDICIEHHIQPKDMEIDGEAMAYLQWKENESEEVFQKRMNDYQKRLEQYNKWYKANKKEIKAKLAARKKKAEEASARRAIKEIKRLKKALEQQTKKHCERCGSPLIPGGLHACD